MYIIFNIIFLNEFILISFFKAFQSPSSMVSTNQLIQPSYQSKHQQQQLQQHSVKHTDQSKSSKKKQKKQSDENLKNTTKNANRSFPLYNQQNGRIGKFIN